MNSCDIVQLRPVRKIRPTRRSVSGWYMFRGESAIAFESTLERDFLIRTEFSLSVLDIIPQPVEIPFNGRNGQLYHYTPDFLVYYKLGNHPYNDYPRPVLVEVKPEAEWKKHWREWQTKWKAARRYAREKGWVFHILDESRIRDQALENIRFLEPYKRQSFPVEESKAVLDSVMEMGCVTLDYLLARHFMGTYRAEGISHIWHLLATRQLDCDISRPFNEFTELWMPTDE
ncbi:MAG: TnsA endonuclease N-terminal domain-containing protein [Azoarcus sp.]|nr:TnsA endonuclease N-terminal domain-containing protein [Azoarcus sp.]